MAEEPLIVCMMRKMVLISSCEKLSCCSAARTMLSSCSSRSIGFVQKGIQNAVAACAHKRYAPSLALNFYLVIDRKRRKIKGPLLKYTEDPDKDRDTLIP